MQLPDEHVPEPPQLVVFGTLLHATVLVRG
jgi:hypothetical protein